MTFGMIVLIYLFSAILYCLTHDEKERRRGRRDRMSRSTSPYYRYYR